MVKNSQIVSVSVTKEQSDFLDSKKISPSGIFQEKIIEIMKRFEEFEKANGKIESLQGELKYLYAFLDENEDFENFIGWKKKNVLAKQT